MISDFDSPDVNSCYLRRASLPSNKIHQPPPRDEASLLPVEIISEIFLFTVQTDPPSRTNLMLVCRLWHDIMLSTPGIHAQLRVYVGSRKSDVNRLGRKWLLDVIVDTGDWEGGTGFNAGEFYASFMAAAEAASRWHSLTLVSLPPPGTCKDLQIMQPLVCLEYVKLAATCELGNFLEPFLTAITTTTTARFTVMEIFRPDAALSLLQPHWHIFSSLTILRLICRRMGNPVDILPHLHKLETFEAHHLFLPIYPPDTDLSLLRTLRVLHLKSVSVQWMEARIFPVLEECTIISPHHADVIQFVDMPSCSILRYDSKLLGTLAHFHLPNLDRLEVKCGQSSIQRGNMQLASLNPIFAAQGLTCLHLQIKCSERLLTFVLGCIPALDELWMGLSSPQTLSSDFFLAFAAGRPNASALIGPSIQAIAPLCRKLKKLHLHYKRWLRGPEKSSLIPTFSDIVASHNPKELSGLSICLSFEKEREQHLWKVHGPVERFDIGVEAHESFIGFSSPHGIALLSTASGQNYDYFRPFGELEYMTTFQDSNLPIGYFFPFHSLREVRVPRLVLGSQPNARFSPSLSFFHTLKVLHVWSIPTSFLAGQTFHQLERYKENVNEIEHITEQTRLTNMPVCTRLVVPLSRLATLKLPRVCELSVCNDGEQPNDTWEKHIAVNTNLSGLKLLHVSDDCVDGFPTIDIIKILRLVPALETLVIDGNCLADSYVEFFGALVPSEAIKTRKGRISGVLCPRLEILQIEGISLTERPELIPVLHDIVTSRAEFGSPLKSFTFNLPASLHGSRGKKWELIGRKNSFMMKSVAPAQSFTLDI